MDRGEGPAVEPRAGQPLQHAAQDHDRSRNGRARGDRARPGDPADPGAAGDTKYVKHERIQQRAAHRSSGAAPMYLGAHVLAAGGFRRAPAGALSRSSSTTATSRRRSTASGEQPPDPNLKREYCDRFHLGWLQPHPGGAGATSSTRTGRAPSYPARAGRRDPAREPVLRRLLRRELRQPRALRRRHHVRADPATSRRSTAGSARGWARFMYGGSTGGWESMAAQIFYPDEYNGAWCACPDPIDFRAFTVVDIYKDKNAYWLEGPWKRVAAPGHARLPGPPVSVTHRAGQPPGGWCWAARVALGQQWDIWEAVYSPVGADGYPKRIWDKRTGAIDQAGGRVLAGELRPRATSCGATGRRAWARSCAASCHIYVGDMDNYYLNNAVYLVEEFLKRHEEPALRRRGGLRRPGRALLERRPHAPERVSRACATTRCSSRGSWSGSRKSAPAGADVTSWKY